MSLAIKDLPELKTQFPGYLFSAIITEDSTNAKITKTLVMAVEAKKGTYILDAVFYGGEFNQIIAAFTKCFSEYVNFLNTGSRTNDLGPGGMEIPLVG